MKGPSSHEDRAIVILVGLVVLFSLMMLVAVWKWPGDLLLFAVFSTAFNGFIAVLIVHLRAPGITTYSKPRVKRKPVKRK
jgi:hypothetical protein